MMSESMLIGLLVGGAIGIALASAGFAVWRFARGSRELGTDGEHATYRTLHLAAKAAEHLRGGLAREETTKAARHLRTLLGCDVLAIADGQGRIVFDGAAESLRGIAGEIAARASEASPVLVVSVPPQAGTSIRFAIVAPILTDGGASGAIIAFSSERRAPLIRATGEVAAWASAQLRLGELDTSRAALAEADLRALRAQISPHFIYNALSAIAAFITTDPPKARDLVLEFADFTRYSFRQQGDFTTLAEELRSVHSYLALERARFGQRLKVVLQIAPETLSVVIPFLSVQPLVENSVRHGLESLEHGGRITITAEEIGTDVQITIEDNGVGIDPDALGALLDGFGDAGLHVGLRNVDARLRQVYGESYGLVVETNIGSGTLVRIRVPRSQPLHDTGSAPAGRAGVTPGYRSQGAAT
jgi:two-component system LytT family sensor kinase